MANKTIYGCVNRTTGAITFAGEACDSGNYTGCIVRSGDHAGQVAVTINEANCDDTYYGCINRTTGQFQLVIPDDCCESGCTDDNYPTSHVSNFCYDYDDEAYSEETHYIKAVFSGVQKCSGQLADFDLTCLHDPSGFVLNPFTGGDLDCNCCGDGELACWGQNIFDQANDDLSMAPYTNITCCGAGNNNDRVRINAYIVDRSGQLKFGIRVHGYRSNDCDYDNRIFFNETNISNRYIWEGTYNNTTDCEYDLGENGQVTITAIPA